MAERVLVGDVVTEIADCVGVGLCAQQVEGVAFAGLDHGKFQDGFSFGDVDPGPSGGAATGEFERSVGVCAIGGVPHVQHGARGLRFDHRPGELRGDLPEIGCYLRE